MSAAWDQIIEDAITGKVVTALLDAGYRVEISDQDGGGLFVYAWETAQRPAKFNHWVRITPGNGADALVDHTTSLETVLKPVNDFCKTWMD